LSFGVAVGLGVAGLTVTEGYGVLEGRSVVTAGFSVTGAD